MGGVLGFFAGLLGLASREMDDDGAGGTITEEQVADLEALISEVGADRDNFLKFHLCRRNHVSK